MVNITGTRSVKWGESESKDRYVTPTIMVEVS